MNIFWINGEFREYAPALTPDDAGIVTGIGVFDSMLAVNGEPQYADEHFVRLIHDADTVIGLSPSLTDMAEISKDLIQKNNLTQGYARIRTVITAGPMSAPLAKPDHLTVMMTVGPAPAPDSFKPARCVIISDFPRIVGCALENCKRLDYTRSFAARRKAETSGGDEAIITNTHGHIACAATSNIFIVENGQWITPPLRDGVLDGVTRRHVIADKNAAEESIPPERLKAAQGIYLTNSFVGLRPATLI
jgi:branched-chain amino acid aminotransferase